MTPNEYQREAARTICDQPIAGGRLLDVRLTQLNHSVIGMVNELGEIGSILQKIVYYGTAKLDDTTRAKLQDEYGDLLWHLCEGLGAIGLTLEEVMRANIAKLRTRYPGAGWSADDWAARDKAAEAAAQLAGVRGTTVVQDGHGFGHIEELIDPYCGNCGRRFPFDPPLPRAEADERAKTFRCGDCSDVTTGGEG